MHVFIHRSHPCWENNVDLLHPKIFVTFRGYKEIHLFLVKKNIVYDFWYLRRSFLCYFLSLFPNPHKWIWLMMTLKKNCYFLIYVCKYSLIIPFFCLNKILMIHNSLTWWYSICLMSYGFWVPLVFIIDFFFFYYKINMD